MRKEFNIEKLNDAFNSSVYYREVGYYVKQREEFERSLKYFDQSLKKEPENIRALYGRAIARAKAIKFSGAIDDIKKILNLDPDNIYLLAEKALITYLGCEFEEALVQNYRNVPRRKRPDNFTVGVMHCEDAIMNCISDRAGKPLRDYFKYIRKIAWQNTLEKQRPYKPIAQKRKKRKKSIYLNLPTTHSRRTDFDLEERREKRHESDKKASDGSGGKLLSVSMAIIAEDSSIKDSLHSHFSSLENFRIPKPPPFPHRPLQRHTTNIENYLAERYLDKLYLDKLFLKNLPITPGTIIANEKGSNKIRQLAYQGYKNIYHAQEMLRSRRPFYFIKYQEATSCGKLGERRQDTLKLLQDMALAQADNLVNRLKNALKERRMRVLLEGIEKLMSFCENTSKKVFPCRQEYLLKMVNLACEGFYELRKFAPHMNAEQRLARVKLVLGLPLKKSPSNDSLANDIRGWFVDWKKMNAAYEKRLFKASGPEELAWLYHELARCSLELNKGELARMYARKCIQEANVCKKMKWIVNAMILIVKIDILQKNKNDAKTQIKHARKVANRLKDEVMVEFMEECIDAVEASALQDALGAKVLEMREKQIIKLLSTQKMKDEAAYLFRRIATLPAPKRMSVMPGFTFTDDRPKKIPSSSESATSEYSKKSGKSKEKKDDLRGLGFLDLIG